ncbi:MAG: hypothetical protein ACOX4B_09460 [Bacillota bacterium]|jgi:hypothetical protein
MYAIVNLLFVVVIPFVAIASVAFAAAHLCKIMRLRFIAERSPHSYRIYSIEAVQLLRPQERGLAPKHPRSSSRASR